MTTTASEARPVIIVKRLNCSSTSKPIERLRQHEDGGLRDRDLAARESAASACARRCRRDRGRPDRSRCSRRRAWRRRRRRTTRRTTGSANDRRGCRRGRATTSTASATARSRSDGRGGRGADKGGLTAGARLSTQFPVASATRPALPLILCRAACPVRVSKVPRPVLMLLESGDRRAERVAQRRRVRRNLPAGLAAAWQILAAQRPDALLHGSS